MERRTEPRTRTNQPATLTVLGDPEQVMQATLDDSSSHGVRLRVPASVPGNTPVEVLTGDFLILGDVCRCTPVPEDPVSYDIAVQVAQRIVLSDLRILHRALAESRQEVPARTRA